MRRKEFLPGENSSYLKGKFLIDLYAHFTLETASIAKKTGFDSAMKQRNLLQLSDFVIQDLSTLSHGSQITALKQTTMSPVIMPFSLH